MFEIHVYASPLSRTLFDAPRDANVRIGDVFVIASEEPRGSFLALVESVESDYAHPKVHGTLTLLARLGDGALLHPPPSRPPYFVGDASAVPQDVATNYFGVAPLEQDPVTKADIQPASLEVGRLLADARVPVAFSAAGFSRHTVLVAQSGSGKSYGLGVILEELLARTRLRLCIIDPNGDFAPAFGSRAVSRSSGSRRRVVVASSRDPSVYDAAIERAARIGQSGCVLDLNLLDVGLWNGVVDKLIGTLWRDREKRTPTLIVIDEAHHFAPAEGDEDTGVSAMILKLAAEGRKFGLWLLLASQRAQKLHRNVISQCDNLILMRMVNQFDIDHVAGSFAGVSREMVSLARGFKKGTALAVGRIVRCPTLFGFRVRGTPEGGGDVSLDWSTQSDMAVPPDGVRWHRKKSNR